MIKCKDRQWMHRENLCSLFGSLDLECCKLSLDPNLDK